MELQRIVWDIQSRINQAFQTPGDKLTIHDAQFIAAQLNRIVDAIQKINERIHIRQEAGE